MYLTRRRIVRKRCLYEFTLRALHIYYRDHYNKALYNMAFEEHHTPSLSEIDNSNALIMQQYVPKNRSGV